VQKPDHPECQTGQSNFPELGQHLYSQEIIRQAVQDSTTVKFRRMESSSIGLSSGALLPSRATNAWAMGASVDDVSTLSTLGMVVWTLVRTFMRFWPWRLLCRKWSLRERRPTARYDASKIGKSDGPEPQTGWSGFPKDSNGRRIAAHAVDAQG
jgi:hypothetical protein